MKSEFDTVIREAFEIGAVITLTKSGEKQSLILLRREDTDADLRDRLKSVAKLKIKGAVVVVSGYDDDPRELDQIPDAVDLLRRYTALGGLAPLARTNRDQFTGAGLGAVDVWAVANGLSTIGKGEFEVPRREFERACAHSKTIFNAL